MLACVSRIHEAYNTAVIRRYLPEIFWFERVESDRFGMITYHFTDVFGHSLLLHGPEMVECLKEFSFNSPIIVAPANLLGEPNSYLTFSIRDVTEYDQYWNGYPRRRRIPSDSEATACIPQDDIAILNGGSGGTD